ncbi:MAG: sulfotransferase family protein [Alphaproteobacteria bacterium]|nr:sulfotransferase family protein [Alphaproteobacteria bacterium]
MDEAPRHVFHHLPKCGGNSLKQAMLAHFVLVDDYAHRGTLAQDHEPAEAFAARRLDLSGIHWDAVPPRLLTGHFDLPGCRLFERYPDTVAPPYRRITFLRDPLARAVSHYRFARETGRFLIEEDSLDAFLDAQRNPIAGLIAANPEEAPEALKRYWFVGVLEEIDRDLAALCRRLGKAPVPVPHVNATNPKATDAGGDAASPGAIERFRQANRIDQALYDWAVAKGVRRSERPAPSARSPLRGVSPR